MEKSYNLGKRFEDRVAKLFEEYVKVDRNQRINHSGMSAEIDMIIYDYEDRAYVECKYRKGLVDLEDVAKFYSVLKLMNIKPSKGIIVTNKGYTKRAERFCDRKKMKYYTIKELERRLKKWKKQI